MEWRIRSPGRSAEQADERTAAALEDSGNVGAFIRKWVSSPMFVRLADAAQTDERLRNTAGGLASSLRLAGTGTQEPLWDRLSDLAPALLALAGTDDTRFAAHALRLAQHGTTRHRFAHSRGRPRGTSGPTGHRGKIGPPLARYGLTKRNPTVRRRPTASCNRAVAANIGSKALPLLPLRARRAGTTPRGNAANARIAHPR